MHIYLLTVRYMISYSLGPPSGLRRQQMGSIHTVQPPSRPTPKMTWSCPYMWYQKVTPKGMAHAFKIEFWEMFSTPGYYDILTDGQYKMPNSNDGCMQLRAPTTCPKWNEGTNEDIKVFQWLSIHTGLTSECVSEVIEPFAKW